MFNSKHTSFRYQLMSLFLQHFGVIILALTIYLLDKHESISSKLNVSILIGLSFTKALYFLAANINGLRKIKNEERTFNHFILLISLNIALIIISFGLDFFCLEQIFPASFIDTISPGKGFSVFEMMYFSLVTFTTTGFGDILPHSNVSRLMVSFEVLIAFITIIFLISNYSNWKSTIENKSISYKQTKKASAK